MAMLVCFVLLSLHIEEGSRSSDAARHYCGDVVTETLSKECDSVFKRTLPDSPAFLDYGDPPSGGVVLGKVESLSLITPKRGFRYKRGGVATECCWKACTIAELTSYCGSPQG
ncbi:hypothetical protein J6590_066609 [Homalodisca vitripennis]|nr:hypothetical protein J6590_066609 [Homalodisca vitripennis]